MTDGIDKLIAEVASLRLQVAQLRGEVAALKSLAEDSDGEAAALRIMLVAWPVVCPTPPASMH